MKTLNLNKIGYIIIVVETLVLQLSTLFESYFSLDTQDYLVILLGSLFVCNFVLVVIYDFKKPERYFIHGLVHVLLPFVYGGLWGLWGLMKIMDRCGC